jgi:phage tail-like protein
MGQDRVSSYLPYLPAVLRQGRFVERFLLAFEAVLSGLPAEDLPAGQVITGLEEILADVDRFFDPARTDPEFLPWLAQWVAQGLRDDWSVETRRAFLAGVVPLYRQRGTRLGIQNMLKLSGDVAQVVDFGDGLDEDIEKAQFGADPKPAHFFGVILTVAERDAIELARRARRVRAIVDREKPAHTYYGLRILYPAMRINDDPKHNTALGVGILINNDPKSHPQYGPGIVLGTKVTKA